MGKLSVQPIKQANLVLTTLLHNFNLSTDHNLEQPPNLNLNSSQYEPFSRTSINSARRSASLNRNTILDIPLKL
jgi:hypothetical protein